ncbi:MAG: Hsp20/alpha crystallin family protein [Deltaproteobacteria bacterium]|nr:Hsp20/alpha crystallin family protein [Deltaproteobacteria bacterium]MBW2661399.1 Hsp20/alpha crystallin family protein [Deltaproteobacteria bacterium]
MVNEKQKLQTKEEQPLSEAEHTRNRRVYIPTVDITETNDAIVLIANMPGVNEQSSDIFLEKSILTITGTIEPEHYKNYRLAHAEYNVGDYRRVFEISSNIDRDKIEATVKNGRLKLILPKAGPAKTKKIEVKAA